MIRNCVQTNGVIMWKTLDTDEATSERTQNTYTHCAATSRGRLYMLFCVCLRVFFFISCSSRKKMYQKVAQIYFLAGLPAMCM